MLLGLVWYTTRHQDGRAQTSANFVPRSVQTPKGVNTVQNAAATHADSHLELQKVSKATVTAETPTAGEQIRQTRQGRKVKPRQDAFGHDEAITPLEEKEKKAPQNARPDVQALEEERKEQTKQTIKSSNGNNIRLGIEHGMGTGRAHNTKHNEAQVSPIEAQIQAKLEAAEIAYARKIRMEAERDAVEPLDSNQKGGCVDHEAECEYWASLGECKTNEKWMNDKCCKSCHKVGKRPVKVNDHY